MLDNFVEYKLSSDREIIRDESQNDEIPFARGCSQSPKAKTLISMFENKITQKN